VLTRTYPTNLGISIMAILRLTEHKKCTRKIPLVKSSPNI
jgi:hypothetical protein